MPKHVVVKDQLMSFAGLVLLKILFSHPLPNGFGQLFPLFNLIRLI